MFWQLHNIHNLNAFAHSHEHITGIHHFIHSQHYCSLHFKAMGRECEASLTSVALMVVIFCLVSLNCSVMCEMKPGPVLPPSWPCGVNKVNRGWSCTASFLLLSGAL